MLNVAVCSWWIIIHSLTYPLPLSSPPPLHCAVPSLRPKQVNGSSGESDENPQLSDCQSSKVHMFSEQLNNLLQIRAASPVHYWQCLSYIYLHVLVTLSILLLNHPPPPSLSSLPWFLSLTQIFARSFISKGFCFHRNNLVVHMLGLWHLLWHVNWLTEQVLPAILCNRTHHGSQLIVHPLMNYSFYCVSL